MEKVETFNVSTFRDHQKSGFFWIFEIPLLSALKGHKRKKEKKLVVNILYEDKYYGDNTAY
jgi:hypothetical protein